jgi:hypothetical protein
MQQDSLMVQLSQSFVQLLHATLQFNAAGRCDEAGDGEEDQAARSSHISSRSDGRAQLRVTAFQQRQLSAPRPLPMEQHSPTAAKT